jgi:membrane carboxypeptidase/penicillin-binding protein
VIACALPLGWHVFLDRRGLPDLEPFLRFEVPVTGHVYDSRGYVLAELAREKRTVVSYDDLLPVVQKALLAAEDKRFFSHAGLCELGPLSLAAKRARSSRVVQLAHALLRTFANVRERWVMHGTIRMQTQDADDDQSASLATTWRSPGLPYVP